MQLDTQGNLTANAAGTLYTDINAIVVPATPNADPTLPFRHRDVRVYSSNIDGSITPSITGDVSGTFSWYTYNNGDYLIFSPTDNNTGNTLTGVITLSAVDTNGDPLTTSYTVTQRPYNTLVTWSPRCESPSNPYLIGNNTDEATFHLICEGITDIGGIVPHSIFTHNTFLDTYYVSNTFTKQDNDHYTVVIRTNRNNTYTRSDYVDLRFTSLETEFGRNPWENYILGEASINTVAKAGRPGYISLSPDTMTVGGEPGVATFSYSGDSYMTLPLTVTHSGDMNITNFAYDGSTITVTYGENSSLIDRSETITVSGKDYQGLTVADSTTITQKVLTYLRFTNPQQTIYQAQTSVTFDISDVNVSNLQVSYSGNVGISNYVLTPTAGGHTLTLRTSANNTRWLKRSTITVSATNFYGATISATATLDQLGLDGLITLDPATRTIPKTGSTFVIGVGIEGIYSTTLNASYSGNIAFTGLRWNDDKTQLTIAYNTNQGSSDLTGSVSVSGLDFNGNTITATCNVTQVTEDSSLTITPNQQVVDTTESTTATFTIDSQYATIGNISFSGDSTNVHSYNLQGNTLTLNLGTITIPAEEIVYVTVSGYDLSGAEITDTATLRIWGLDGYFTINGPDDIGWRKSKAAGYADYVVSSFGISNNTITTSVDQSWATIGTDPFNNQSAIVYSAYSGTPTTWDANRQCVWTLSGVDYKGNTITETRTLIQYALDAEMSISPTTATIEYNGYIDVDVTLVGPAQIPSLIFTVALGSFTYTWLNEWGTGTTRTNTVRITPPVNTSPNARQFSITFKSIPLYSSGSTIWRYLNVTQEGKPATITITPATSTVNKDAGSIVYDIVADGVSYSSLQRTYSAADRMISSAEFNSDKTQLIVVYNASDIVANRTATISVYSDELGDRITGQATITQTGIDPVLTAYDLAIRWNQPSATNFVTTKGVDNLSVSFVGNANINTSYFVPATGGQNLTIVTYDNDTNSNLTCVATITGTVTEGQYEGETRTTTFNITKYGKESVTLVPSSRVLDYGENTTTYTVTAVNVNNLQVNVSGDTSFITDRSLVGSLLTITTADFAAKTAKTATITVSGTGFSGTVSGSATLTKYGPDGTIETNTDTLTFPRSAYSKFVVVNADGITNALTVAYNGTFSPSNIELSGTTLTVSLNTNTTESDLTGSITLTGTDYKGNTITKTISVVQKPYDSFIQLTPSSKTVNKNAGSTTYTIESDSVDLNTLRISYTGDSITNATVNGNTVTVTYRENTAVATKNNTITATVTDIYSSSISADAVLLQTGVDPTMSVNNISILSTQANATAFVSTNGIGTPMVVWFSGNVNVTEHSISSTSGGFNINIVTADNLTNDVLTSTATVIATVTEGQYAGETRTTTFTITKFGLEGIITIDPSTLTVRKAGEVVEFDVALGNMQDNTVTASTGTFNSDKTKLTVNVLQNTSSTDRTINVVVSGTDNNGNTKSATAVITQYGIDPYINISPASRTLRSDTANTTYSITTYKVSSLEFDFTGAVNVVDYSYEGSTLYVSTADNLDQFQQMTIITVTGVDELGATVSATARLIKAGLGGGILVDSDYTIPSNAGALAIEYSLEEVDPDSIIVATSGDILITHIILNRNDKFALIRYESNRSSDPITGKIFISGVGEDGQTKLSTIDLTQLGSNYMLKITPTSSSKTYSITNHSADVELVGIESTTFEYGGSLVPSSCTFERSTSSTGTISATFSVNDTDEYKHLYMTINGITTGGSNITSSAVMNQEPNLSSGPYIFMLQPASQAVKVVEASQNTVSYTINSIKGYDQVDYSITGFILSGRWGTRPYADGKRVVVPLNTHSEEREVRVIYTQDVSLKTLEPRIIQQEGVEPEVNPIWKEFSTTADVNDFVEYHIKLGSDIIYAGKAYKYPDASEVAWSINDAVSNYLGNGLSFVEGIQQIPDYSKDFYMEDNIGNKYVETFYNSWAYEDTDYWLSDPIDNRVDPRQWLPVSFLSTNYEMITVGGRSYAAFKENDGWTVMTRLRNHILNCNDVIALGEDGTRMNYRFDKGDYVLYYSNAYGGWDSLLCNGTSKKTDNIEHLTYRRKSRNQADFSKINYQNNITPTWSLKTGITVDGQKMYHLLESTMVYLHNLETDEIVPVVITNSNCEYLNYTNNGKRPYFYDITVEESNQKLRK